MNKEDLGQILSYDEDTGVFTYRENGKVAGSIKPDGYRMLHVKGQKFRAARVAWLFVNGEWPNFFIDHIDGDRSNDSIRNLRQASARQNAANRKRPSNNTSGFKGVSFLKHIGKFVASGIVDGKVKALAYCETAEAAAEIYARHAARQYGEFARVS